MNPYQILGVSQNATIDQIKVAYKRLAKKYHPDISKEPNVLDMMKKINNAYDILTKPQLVRRPIQQPQYQKIVFFYGNYYGNYYGYNGTSTTNSGYF